MKKKFGDKEIEFVDTNPPIDWEQRRYEIAKEVLASSFSTPMEGASIMSYIHDCVHIADMLIEELKGSKD